MFPVSLWNGADILKFEIELVNKFPNLHFSGTSLNNSICHFSKIINADKSIFYSGQIINQFSEDCFLLKNDANNNYQFIKTNLEALIPTCSMP